MHNIYSIDMAAGGLKYGLQADPTSIQVGLFAGLILSLWFAELFLSTQPWKSKWNHTKINLLFTSTALPLQVGLILIVLLICNWVTTRHWGILYLLPWSGSAWIKYLFGFLLLDFFEYFYHRMMHKVHNFWRFHMVHHSDPEVDVSTTVREHPGETILRVLFLAVVVFASGASLGLLAIRQTVQTVSNLTSHTDLMLPAKADRILNKLFITPNLHHVHHHFELPYTDCNYGDVLSIWDRLFGTFREKKDIEYGVDVWNGEAASSFFSLMKAPLSKINRKLQE